MESGTKMERTSVKNTGILMQYNARLLIVDDDEDILQAARFLLKSHFREVVTTTQPMQISQLFETGNFDVVLLDMNFQKGKNSGAEGIHWLRQIKQNFPAVSVVMLTAYGDVSLAMQAIREGASDFVLKPWVNEKLLATLASALKLQEAEQNADKLETVNQQLQQDLAKSFSEIIGNSAPMRRIFSLIEKVAPTDANVLILGENGTGKEVVARAIHANSLRKNEAFIGIDVGALPPNLFESELFGHTKGAFTDAQNNRIGRFEMANNGTLFLDEIGNIPIWLQAKLLTALQTRTITPVGSNAQIPVDIRLICATNQPLQNMIAEKRFREDLHYRINTIEINLPPLREREDDVELLSQHFLQQFGQKYNKGLRISPSAIKCLKSYHWPGNVRELQHTIERAVILANSTVLEADAFLFPSEKKNGNGLVLEDYNLQNAEKQLILKVLERTEGNISKAAKQLGLTRAALYRRLEKYGF